MSAHRRPTVLLVKPTLRWTALGVAAIVVWWMWPSRLGGPTTVLAVEGNSMQPTFNSGDLVVAHTETHYHVGDIVVIRVPTGDDGKSALIVHRLTAVEPDGDVITQGDNRTTADGFNSTTGDIVGRARWRIPHGAELLGHLSRWWALAGVVGVLVTIRLWPTTSIEHGASARQPTTDP